MKFEVSLTITDNNPLLIIVNISMTIVPKKLLFFTKNDRCSFSKSSKPMGCFQKLSFSFLKLNYSF